MTRPPTSYDSRPPTGGRGILGGAVQFVILLLLLATLIGVCLVLLAVASLVNVPGQVTGGLGSRLGGVASEAARTLQNATDPNHPPASLVYDNEFMSLQRVRVGDALPGGSQYVLSLQAIKRRDGSDSPDVGQYAVVHAELRQPRETRFLGQLVRSDSDPHDHPVYKGETFRIGHALYRVNWVSEAEGAFAIASYRNPDGVTASLKFGYD